MPFRPDLHLPEETIRGYCLLRLPEESVAAVEEHFLACEECQDEIALMDRLVQALADYRLVAQDDCPLDASSFPDDPGPRLGDAMPVSAK